MESNAGNDIMEGMNNMLQMCIKIDSSNCSQQIKDKSKQYFNEALDFAKEELSSQKINRLVYQEYKKSKTEKLK